ncbi:hypothetical protein DVH05_023080 [Phytophthora capsici]|nr:hypothetical protein DVH05_023080 [Phytophthora capsici]
MAPKNSKKKSTKVVTPATAAANAAAGKTKNKKRAERIAKTSPYQTKQKRKGEDKEAVKVQEEDEEVVKVQEEDEEAEEEDMEVEDVKEENAEVKEEKTEEDSTIGCRVFVTNMSWDTKVDDLKDHMKAAGPVKDAIILGSGNHSTGCGIVTFANEKAAKKAIATLMESELKGRNIFVREDRQALPAPRKSERNDGDEDVDMDKEDTSIARRVFVTNLPWKTKSRDLKEHMQAAGPVESANVLMTDGRSTGRGVVTYETEEAAKNAIATLNDSELDGRKITIREDRQGPVISKRKRGTRVYVGNLGYNVKWPEFKDHMKKAGTVLYADIIEASTGRSSGCGLVEYSSEKEAAKAIAELHDTEIEGRRIFVREDRDPDGASIAKLAKRVPRDEGPRQLYVGNLPSEMDWMKLKDLFNPVGQVERADCATGSDGRPRGFGIVRFAHSADASKAIELLNGKEVEGRVITVRMDKKE